MKPEPTKTFVLDVGRHCNINCRFCYYRQLGDLRLQGWKSQKQLMSDIQDGVARGNNRVEITGGEPTMYPWIYEIVETLKDLNIDVCIITNGIVAESQLKSLIDSGVDEFLISIHGTEETHDRLTAPGARKAQIKTLETLYKAGLKDHYRFNYVVNSFNQHDILNTAQWMSQWLPTIVNFINMNPHHEWVNDKDTKNVIADLRVVEPLLNQAIEYLESVTIDINVRYYPMCRIAEEYRRCICNDLHVCFDPKEWDYCTLPKTYERYKQWGIDTSNNVEEKGDPCCRCDLQWICGGANKYWHRASNQVHGEILIPQKIKGIDKDDFYYYRKDNFLESNKWLKSIS